MTSLRGPVGGLTVITASTIGRLEGSFAELLTRSERRGTVLTDGS